MLASLIPMPPVGGAATPERLRQAAQGFEAQVMAQMLQPVFATADSSKSAFGGGAAEAQWRPMLVEGFAAAAARGGRGLGLQEVVLRQMIRMQEARQQDEEIRR
jgi:flagellar protein FlgJ